MPLYEYLCGKCGQQYESYKRLTEEKKEETCPACGGQRGENGDLPVHRQRDLARGRLLLRHRPAPFAVRVSVIHRPAVAGPGHEE